MSNLTATLCLTVTLLLGSVGASASAYFQKGLDAALSGEYATALQEFTHLSEKGDARGQWGLGALYERGDYVPQNYKIAVKWYKLISDQGYLAAQIDLGLKYMKGLGVPHDYKTTLKWYRLSAEQEHATAQINMGRMYALGYAVIKDNIYAHMWANLAASNGEGDGAKLRDIVAKLMTPSELEKAQNLARECVRKTYKGC